MSHFYLMDKVETPLGKGTISEFTLHQAEIKVWVGILNAFHWFKNEQLKNI
jgi:hypothetical protein